MSAEGAPDYVCPPEVIGHINDMRRYMKKREYNHAGTPTQFAIELMKAGLIDSFVDFEKCLRAAGSRVYFIAVPTDYFGADYKVGYPLGREGDPDFVLYAAVNGSKEAAAKLEEIGVTPEENLVRLETTGVLVVAYD